MFDQIELSEVKQHFADLHYTYGSKPRSNDFCGFTFHGSNKPFTLEEHEVPIKTFRCFSEYSYPLYLFINLNSIGELDELLRIYDNIKVVSIEPMMSINDYDEFVINKMFGHTSIENTLTFHSDGFLLNPGWESFVVNNNIDYIGAPWCGPTGSDGQLFVDGCERFYDIQRQTNIGNGGFCFRRRSKCLQVLERVDQSHLNWNYVEGHLPDDVFFSYFGFGLGIFESYDLSLAFQWAREPIVTWDTIGFHRTQVMINRKLASLRQSMQETLRSKV